MGDFTLNLVSFLLNFSWFVYWSFSGYASSIGILRGSAGEVSFAKIFTRDLNASFCEIPNVTSGLSNAESCTA